MTNEDALKAFNGILGNLYSSNVFDYELTDWCRTNKDTIRKALKLASVAKIALESIANNTCCDKCNEASKVAREAITKFKEIKDE